MGVNAEKLAVGMAALYFYKDAEKIATKADAAADQKEIQVAGGSEFVEELPMGGAVAQEDTVPVLTDETDEANGAGDMALLSAAPVADEDAYYFGHLTKQFQTLRVDIKTPGEATTQTITWKYWDGSVWKALSNVIDGTVSFTAAAGKHDVIFDLPTDWKKKEVEGITAYWIKADLTAYDSITTAPVGNRAWIMGEELAMSGAVAEDDDSQEDETAKANSAIADDMALLPAVLPVATEDCYYFGHATKQFQTLRLNIGVPGEATTLEITWKYWDGDSWEPLDGVIDDTNSFKAAAGKHDVSFTLPADWAKKEIKGINGYWIQADLTTYTAGGAAVQPKGTQAWIIGIDKKLTITDYDNFDRGLSVVSIEIDDPGAGTDTITVDTVLGNTYATGSHCYPELDLGNVRAVGIEPALTYLQHFNARTGTKVMDKEVVTQKEIRVPFTWEELKVDNMNWFLYGGAVTAGKFTVLTNPQRKGAALLVFNPEMQDKPYQKIEWLIPSCYIKANGSFGFNDADWMGADGILEVLCMATHLYGKMTVSSEV